MNTQELIPYSTVFRRRRQPYSSWASSVIRTCKAHAYKVQNLNVGSPVFSATEATAHLLDGDCSWRTRGYNENFSNIRLFGELVERFVCYELGIEQPRVRKGEALPSHEELLRAAKKQQSNPAKVRSGRLTADELGLGSSLIVARRSRRGD